MTVLINMTALLMLALTTTAAHTQEVVIRFNDPAEMNIFYPGTGPITGREAHLQTQGFEFYTGAYGKITTPDGQLKVRSSDPPNGHYLMPFSLFRLDGQRFNLVSMRVSSNITTELGLPARLGVSLVGGPSTSLPAYDQFESEQLNLGWNDLSYAHLAFQHLLAPGDEIRTAEVWLDDFVLTPAVPEPASATLLALGLLAGGAALQRRRR